jgi:hypothetical protein
MHRKTFNLTAITSKGNFEVAITVWKEKVQWSEIWMDQAFLQKDGEGLQAIFDSRNPTFIKCPKLCIELGAPAGSKIKCDCIEVVQYMNQIDKPAKDESSDTYKAFEDSKKAFNLYHNS